jgi:hypothetical protein
MNLTDTTKESSAAFSVELPIPKTKFQTNLKALLTDAVRNLKNLAKDVQPKEELEILSLKNSDKRKFDETLHSYASSQLRR